LETTSIRFADEPFVRLSIRGSSARYHRCRLPPLPEPRRFPFRALSIVRGLSGSRQRRVAPMAAPKTAAAAWSRNFLREDVFRGDVLCTLSPLGMVAFLAWG
jgi:hypothetical protein